MQKTNEILKSKLTITLIGDPGTGKTSINQTLIGKPFQNQQMTVGAQFTFYNFSHIGFDIKLKICDIAGQQSFKTVRSNFMTHSDGALMVFDLTNPSSFENVEDWIFEYLNVNKKARSNLPILIIGNKSDLSDEIRVNLRVVGKFLELAEQNFVLSGHIIGYLETSAKTGENILEGFHSLTHAISLVQ